MTAPRFPWPMGDKRRGGPLLGPGGLSLPPVQVTWDPESAETLPDVLPFLRADVAQVLTTTDGSPWHQEADINEVRLQKLRRIKNLTLTGTLDDFAEQNGAVINGDELTFFSSNSEQALFDAGVLDEARPVGYRITLRAQSGTPQVRLRILGTTVVNLNPFLSTTPQTFFFAATAAPGDTFFVIRNQFAVSATIEVSSVAVGYLQSVSSPPFEFVDPTIEHGNVGVNGVKYFNTINDNSTDVNGLVTESVGAVISGGGFLGCEPTSTNRLDMEQSAWTEQGVVTSDDKNYSDIGARTWQMADLGALGVDDLSQSVGGFTASGPVAPSFWVQRVTSTGTLGIVNAAGGAANGEWQVDLALILAGWVRLEPGADVPGFSEITPWVADGTGNAGMTFYAVAGGPLAVRLALRQCEDRLSATSSIVTSGGLGTRSEEKMTGPDWTAEHGALVDCTPPQVVEDPNDRATMLGYTAGSANRTYLFGANGTLAGLAGFSGLSIVLDPGVTYLNRRSRFAWRGKTGDTRFIDNEGNATTSAVGEIGSGAINVGRRSNGTDQYRGIIHKFTTYSDAPTDQQLNQIVQIRNPVKRIDPRVLVVEPFNGINANTRIMFMLAVEEQGRYNFGDPLQQVRNIRADVDYDFIYAYVEFPGVSSDGKDGPWYVEEEEDDFVNTYVPLVENFYPQVTKQSIAVGFSKSGWGLMSMMINDLTLFERGIVFDAPLTITTIPAGAGYIFDVPFSQYDLNLRAPSAGFVADQFYLTRYNLFQTDMEDMHDLLDLNTVPHFWEPGTSESHQWRGTWFDRIFTVYTTGL